MLAEVNLRSHASYQMVNRHRPSASWTGNSRRGLTRRLTEWDKVEKWPHRLRHLTVGACSKAPPQPPTVQSRRARASHPHPSRALARKQETAHLPFAHRDVAEPWGVQTPSGSPHSPSLPGPTWTDATISQNRETGFQPAMDAFICPYQIFSSVLRGTVSRLTPLSGPQRRSGVLLPHRVVTPKTAGHGTRPCLWATGTLPRTSQTPWPSYHEPRRGQYGRQRSAFCNSPHQS